MLRIKELRLEREKTQGEIAKILGVSRQVYANYENSINEPPLEMLKKIADFFEVTIDYLLGREDDFGNIAVPPTPTQLLSNEQTLLDNFRKLPEDLQYRASAYMENLVKLGVSEKQSNFTHKNYPYKKTVNK